ncbi:uncharacterized protein [Malus domestica]|uniref:uncharacterized protein isoform X2 n=1 Tax=Malus domestica TaxID=3750 RepID=UPI0039756CE2
MTVQGKGVSRLYVLLVVTLIFRFLVDSNLVTASHHNLRILNPKKTTNFRQRWYRRRGKTKENNKFIRQFDEFELSGDKKVQLKLVQQWLARERSKMKEKNSNSKPEVLEANAGETNKLAKNFGSKEEETDKSTEDVIHKEDETDELDKKRAEVSQGAAKKRRKRNKKKKLAGRTGASIALLSFLSGLYMGAANLPGLVSRSVMDGLVSRFTSLLPRRVIGWLSA